MSRRSLTLFIWLKWRCRDERQPLKLKEFLFGGSYSRRAKTRVFVSSGSTIHLVDIFPLAETGSVQFAYLALAKNVTSLFERTLEPLNSKSHQNRHLREHPFIILHYEKMKLLGSTAPPTDTKTAAIFMPILILFLNPVDAKAARSIKVLQNFGV